MTQDHFIVGNTQQYVRLYYEEARSRAHLYIRRQRKHELGMSHVENRTLTDPPTINAGRGGGSPKPQGVPDFKSVVEFREIPPGGYGNAFTVAALTALIITYFAIFSARIGLDPDTQDIPAIILTLPAFLAAAIGRGMDPESLRRISLTTFYGLWTESLLSVLAVLLYIYSVTRGAVFIVAISVFGHDIKFDLAWVILAVASICMAAYLRREKRAERFYYLDRIHEVARDEPTNGIDEQTTT